MTDLLPSAAADVERMERELQALRTALAARNSEFGERIEHQAATIEVLKAMSASPGDPQPVFDLIARQAAKLCNVPTAAVATFDGTMMHLATQSGFDAAYADAYVSQFPRPVGLDSSMGRAILHRRVDQVEDITTAPGHSFVDVLGHWSVMAVPILRDGVPLGAITIGRPAMGPFSDSPGCLAANLRRAGGDRHQQRRDISRIAGTHRRAGPAQQRIRRADRAAVRHHRRAEGHVGVAGDPQPSIRADRRTRPPCCEADGVAVALLEGDSVAPGEACRRDYADSDPRA